MTSAIRQAPPPKGDAKRHAGGARPPPCELTITCEMRIDAAWETRHTHTQRTDTATPHHHSQKASHTHSTLHALYLHDTQAGGARAIRHTCDERQTSDTRAYFELSRFTAPRRASHTRSTT